MDPPAIVPIWVSPLLAAIVVVMTTAFAWSAARPVLREPTGPALPERLQVWRGQQQFAAAVAIALLVFSGRHAAWSIPAVWLALQLVTHVVRRRSYGDAWTFAGQLAWTLRAYLATTAFWWAAALAPLGLLTFEAPAGAVVATGLVLVAWNHFYGDILLAILGATPLTRPELDPVFEAVLARARVARPRLMRAGPRGARIANAFAFAHPRGDVVLFFDALLDHATPAEAAGVLAHEVGHLEDFAPRRWPLYAHGALLGAGAAASTLALRAAADAGLTQAGVVIWAGVVFVSLILRARDSQQRERESDRRAVELCGGDGEALVDALRLLRTLALAPRRLDPAHERRATHPSLARRIRAIRAASGAPPDLLAPRAIAGAEPTRAVVFERERLVFVGAPAAVDVSSPAAAVAGGALDAIPYVDLIDLRTEPSRTGGVILVAVDGAGRARRLRIGDADTTALDALLDLADQRIATDAPALPASPALDRLVAGLAAIAVLAAGAWTLVFAALAVCLTPTASGLAAIAAGTVVAAMRPGPSLSIGRLALVLVGVVCAAMALRRWRAQRDAGQHAAWRGVLLQTLATAFAALWPTWWIVALGRADVVALHVAARAWVSAAAGWAALGAVFLVLPRRLGRIAGAACLAMAVAVGALASDAIRDRYAPDPLIATGAPPLAIDDLPAAPLARLTLVDTYWSIALAPDARHVLLRGQIRGGSPPRVPFTLAGFDGWRRTIEAQDAALVDATTVLVARADGTARVLTAESIRDGAVRWTLRVPDAPDGPLDVDPSGRWRLPTDGHGQDGPSDVPTAPPAEIEGRIGDTSVVRRAAPLRLRLDFVGQHRPLSWTVQELSWRTEIATTGRDGPRRLARTRLAVECFGTFLASPIAPCVASTGDETFLWTVDVERGTLHPTARMDGRVIGAGDPARVGLVWHDRELLLLSAGQTRALRVSTGDHCPCPHGAAASGGHVATLTSGHDQSTIAVYRIAR
jgi:Zn-dependent protease with chaperone function